MIDEAKIDQWSKAIDGLDAALCQALNCYSDRFTPKRDWETETRENMHALSAAYEYAHKVGAMNLSDVPDIIKALLDSRSDKGGTAP